MKKDNKSEIIEKALSLLKEANDKGVTNYRISQDTKLTEPSLGNWVKGATKPTQANAKILIDYFSKEGNMLKNISDSAQVSEPQGIYGNNDVISLLREQITDLKLAISKKDIEIGCLNQEIGHLKGLLAANSIELVKGGTDTDDKGTTKLAGNKSPAIKK